MKTFFVLLWRLLQGAAIALAFWVVLWWLATLLLGEGSEAGELSAWDRKELSRELAREAAGRESAGARQREVRKLLDESLRGRRLSAYARERLARDVAAHAARRAPTATQRAEVAAVLSRGIRDSGLKAYDRLELSRAISESMTFGRDPASHPRTTHRSP